MSHRDHHQHDLLRSSGSPASHLRDLSGVQSVRGLCGSVRSVRSVRVRAGPCGSVRVRAVCAVRVCEACSPCDLCVRVSPLCVRVSPPCGQIGSVHTISGLDWVPDRCTFKVANSVRQVRLQRAQQRTTSSVHKRKNIHTIISSQVLTFSSSHLI